MKQFFIFLFSFLMVCSAKAGTVQFSGSESITSTNTYDDATVSFVSDTWNFKSATNISGFTGYWSGTNNPNNNGNSAPTSGSAIAFTPTESGTLTVYAVINNGKKIFALEDGSQIGFTVGGIAYASGDTLPSKYYGGVDLAVTSGKTYYLFCTGSKMGYFGFGLVAAEGSGNEEETSPSESADQAPAFPGAEGHGRYTTGGRGGEIRHVTNLEDSGTGSFRAAVSGNSNKIVVFDVSGVIALASDLTIGQNTTILGQTAPSPGITLRYYTVRPSANNIIRYIRIRRGQEKDVNDGADATWQRNVNNIILDHCSFSWSIDEVASFYDNNNFTMQWCTIGESLTNAGHDKGAHGYGGIWGGKLASFHHNLLIHLNNRVPRFNGARYLWSGYTSNSEYATYQWENPIQAENVDFRNCVMYNWGNGNGCYGGPGGGQINIVNNYYKAGPATSNKTRVTQISVADSGNASTKSDIYGMTSRYYISGNYVASASSPQNYDWSGVIFDSGVSEINGEKYTPDPNNYYGSGVTHVTDGSGVSCVKIKMDSPCPVGTITTHTAVNAYAKVLDYAGASLYRDDVDARFATETRGGTATYTGSVTKLAGIVDVVSDVNGYTEANFSSSSRTADFDTDNDGIPDAWECLYGLNPYDASDALTYTLDKEKSWYTNLEVYANSLVESNIKLQNSDAVSAVDEYYPELVEDPVCPLAVSSSITWASACFSYKVSIPDGVKVYYASSSSNGTVHLTQLEGCIPAGEGVIIQATKGEKYLFASTQEDVAAIDNLFGGTTAATAFANKSIYVLGGEDSNQNPIFKLYGSNSADASATYTLAAGKAYLPVSAISGLEAASARITFVFDEETGIDEISSVPADPGTRYDCSGRRVGQNAHGLIFEGGRKMLVR